MGKSQKEESSKRVLAGKGKLGGQCEGRKDQCVWAGEKKLARVGEEPEIFCLAQAEAGQPEARNGANFLGGTSKKAASTPEFRFLLPGKHCVWQR